MAAIRQVLPAERILLDRFSRIAHGTDASCYKLVPDAVLLVNAEEEVAHVCRAASENRVPITFRAAGTSLSGQAVTSSVLVKLGHNGWRSFVFAPETKLVKVGPGMVGGHVNARLARFGRKIGPDPASIGAAMMGGIAANNSSGMCCGVEQNAYRTLHSMRIVLADGTSLNTADPESRAAFAKSHGAMLDALSALAREVQEDAELVALIRRKYAIKNTTGYSINALVDYADPIDILQHLLIGSEGTLAFMGELTLATVPDPKQKSAALILFRDMRDACAAAARLKSTPVSAVELMDYASLQSVIGKPGIPQSFANLPQQVCALLVDLRADDSIQLQGQEKAVGEALRGFDLLTPISFAQDASTYANYWNVRKGLLPSVGGMRPTGTTVIVEDVAVPTEHLADAAIALRSLLDGHGYADAIVFGHALDGNLHFVFPQSFETPEQIARYAALMEDVTRLVAVRFSGSLKAEHGTGRNMAPFVELEWGTRAYELMRRIKAIFDPKGVLNPGVVICDDPGIHLRDLKQLPSVNPVIDKCIECGFCEPVCPSRALSLTPRQRIAATRAMAGREGETGPFAASYAYQAVETCAGDGLCARNCPVGIDTGEMMRLQRARKHGAVAKFVARQVRKHLPLAMSCARGAVRFADMAHALLGPSALERLARMLRIVTGGLVPPWTRFMPRPAAAPPRIGKAPSSSRPRVVLFASCVSSVMGPAKGAPHREELWHVMKLLLERAGYEVDLVGATKAGCCGMPFRSKGFFEEAAGSVARLKPVLLEASRGGADPIICDTSPCAATLLSSHEGGGLRILDTGEGLEQLVLPKLKLHQKAEKVALHVACSTRKLGKDAQLVRLAAACAEQLVIPEEIECCGFAGDKGFNRPELNTSALRLLREQIPDDCSAGYSTSRTCEIGLSAHSGRHYQSIAYLLEWCSRPEEQRNAQADETAPLHVDLFEPRP